MIVDCYFTNSYMQHLIHFCIAYGQLTVSSDFAFDESYLLLTAGRINDTWLLCTLYLFGQLSYTDN